MTAAVPLTFLYFLTATFGNHGEWSWEVFSALKIRLFKLGGLVVEFMDSIRNQFDLRLLYIHATTDSIHLLSRKSGGEHTWYFFLFPVSPSLI